MSPENWSVNAVLRGRVLLLTQSALSACSDAALRERVELLNAAQFEAAARNLCLRWQVVQHQCTHGMEITELDSHSYLIQLCHAASAESSDGPKFVTLNGDQLASLGAGEERVEKDTHAVEQSFTVAKALLDSGFPEGAERVKASVRFVMGLVGCAGELRGFSSARLPGFVAVGTNVPPLLVAEQLVHEATHVALECLLTADEDTRSWLDSQPSLPSPFTSSVRPARLLLHGWLSYGMVLALWERAADLDCLECGFHSRAEQLAAATRRRALLITRIADARAQLDEFVDDRARLRELASHFGASASSVSPAAHAGGPLPNLGRHERAELTLAIAGMKVSRITVDSRTGFTLARAIRPSGRVCFSRHTLHLEQRPEIGGFSNRATTTTGWDDQGIIYGYVASKAASARVAAKADELDEAGEFFEIPSCCQAWFRQAWPVAAAEHGGDVVAMLLSNTRDHFVEVAADAPLPAVYFESGLHFHFPCGAFCKATIALVKSRRDALQRLDSNLLAELTNQLFHPYLWVRGRAYIRLDDEAPEEWDVRGDETVRTALASHHVRAADIVTGAAGELLAGLFRSDWRLLRPV